MPFVAGLITSNQTRFKGWGFVSLNSTITDSRVTYKWLLKIKSRQLGCLEKGYYNVMSLKMVNSMMDSVLKSMSK